jgi:hypothetical protein
MKSKLALLGLLGFLVQTPSITKAQGVSCWGYVDNFGTCSDNAGCQGEYDRTECVLGCVHGVCNNNGGSGECCGTIYYTAVLVSDGDSTSCQGSLCGDSPVRRAALREKRRGRFKDIAQPKLTPEDFFLAYRPPRILFLPSNCSQKYEVFLEGYVPDHRKGGM